MFLAHSRKPAPLAAVGPPADEGGSAMDVADGDGAARQGGALDEGDGAGRLGTGGVGEGYPAGEFQGWWMWWMTESVVYFNLERLEF